jgi:hypothetical protein
MCVGVKRGEGELDGLEAPGLVPALPVGPEGDDRPIAGVAVVGEVDAVVRAGHEDPVACGVSAGRGVRGTGRAHLNAPGWPSSGQMSKWKGSSAPTSIAPSRGGPSIPMNLLLSDLNIHLPSSCFSRHCRAVRVSERAIYHVCARTRWFSPPWAVQPETVRPSVPDTSSAVPPLTLVIL